MFNVFEQPWTLLVASVLVLLGVFTFRSVWPEKRKPWQLLLPLIVASLAFGLDALVTTDLEKVHAVVRASIRAVQNEDSAGVATCIAPDYHDDRHASKADLVKLCREQLAGPTVAKIKKVSENLELSENRAEMTLLLSFRLEEQSQLARRHGVLGGLLRVRLHLTKQPDRRWLINSIELLEFDQFPVSWSDI